MSDDGAQLGYDAGQALGAVLGGEQPAPEERASAGEMGARIMSLTANPGTYEGTADWTAKQIVEWLTADPSRVNGPVENVYLKDDAGQMVWEDGHAVVLERGWYDRMKADGVALDDGMTGFMWGWSVNAARRLVELPEVPNPAIVTI